MKMISNVTYKVMLVVVFGVVSLGLGGCAKTASVEQSSAVQQKVIEYAGEDGKSVCDILKEKYQVNAQTSAPGMMVSAINGLAATDKEFWLYSVNGNPGEVACDKQQTKTGDKVKWEYKGF